MLQGSVVIAIALAYLGLLFVVASYGDRMHRRDGGQALAPLIYPLSLASTAPPGHSSARSASPRARASTS